MFKKKILVVDDTAMMVRLIRDILSGADYSVVTASSGEECIQKVHEEKPDLVLLDVVMRGMDGFEACRLLREDEGNNLMPIIMLTAQEDEEAKLEGLEMGADDYIIKPFNPRELLSRVKNTLLRIDRNRLANPLTGLHGNIEIQNEINFRIAKRELFAVIYADLDNFKAYNDVYGIASGDRAIKLTADILKDSVHSVGNSTDFVGHVGGDDFVILSQPDYADALCDFIIKTFDEKILSLYSQEDRTRGFIVTQNRQGQTVQYPVISISIAVVTNHTRVLISHIQIAEIAAELKKRAKSLSGSVYVKDKRKG